MFQQAYDEFSRISDGYEKIRGKVDSAFDEMNKMNMFSFDSLALLSRLEDVEAELVALEGQIEPCKSFSETIHRAAPFNQTDLRRLEIIWERIKTKRKGVEQALSTALDRIRSKSIWTQLATMIQGILGILRVQLGELVFELGQLTGRIIKSLPWMED